MELIGPLLQGTSRTFALSIPLLGERLQREIAVAYLLFRIADTIEDELDTTAPQRVRAMHELCAVAAERDRPSGALERALRDIGRPDSHDGYALLLDQSALVLGTLHDLDSGAAELIARHLARTAEGMCGYIERNTPLTTLAELREYCYIVAGIVGDLCTDLYVHAEPALAPAADRLRALAPQFGEALQLVNILRDAADDADQGRWYLPDSVAREDVARLAADDLDHATTYVETLEAHDASPGVVAFNALNLALAIHTLAAVNAEGPGAKLTRDEVKRLHAEVVETTGAGRPMSPSLRAAARAAGITA